MINSFYQALIECQAWFFGDMLNDSFFAFIVKLFNSGLFLGMFYSVFVYPLKRVVSFMISHIKGV